MRTLPHPDRLRELVSKIAWGAAAAGIQSPGPVLALPHAAKVSRYGSSYIHWAPSIVVAPGTAVSWRIVERDTELTGRFTVHSPDDIEGDYPVGAPAPVFMRRTALVTGGSAARFELVGELEPHVRELLEASNRFVARELEGRSGDEAEGWAPITNHGVADGVSLDSLAGELLWGAGDQPDSTVLRMVDRAALTHINNQPLGSWFDTNLRARSEEAVRRLIGDPHIGRKIRRFAKESKPSSIEELIELYRRAHPKESVGRDRIIAALSADKTIDAVSYSLNLLTNVPDAPPLSDDDDAQADS